MVEYKNRYEGERWALLYGTYAGVEKHAVNELQKACQSFFPYVMITKKAEKKDALLKNSIILIGLPSNNHLIRELLKKKLIKILPNKESFTVACIKSPWAKGKKVIVATGNDVNGVLYGVMELNEKIEKLMPKSWNYSSAWKKFNGMEHFNYSDYPRIANRGFWTWGYPIFDYRRYFDNMAKLRLNTVIIWNDRPPLNIKEVIDSAHGRGLKVIMGFPWGWGMDGWKLSEQKDRLKIKKMILDQYKNIYSKLDIEGIYFQTLTEHHDTALGGKTVAHLASVLTNEIGRALLAKTPKLKIYFGLHATSILKNYTDTKILDKRITIMWEDAGVLPYSYDPHVKESELIHKYIKVSPELYSFEKTLAYSKKLATLRKGAEFALVPKGWICIDWNNEFEHHEEFILGERSAEFIRQRLKNRRAPEWNKVNKLWEKNFKYAARFYKEMLKLKLPAITAAGLVEDACFEEKIQPSVRMFGKMLWNPYKR